MSNDGRTAAHLLEVIAMKSTRRLVIGVAVAAATAVAVWGPTAVLAGLTATAAD
jgi:ABC-type enterochelin transport system permease subunit